MTVLFKYDFAACSGPTIFVFQLDACGPIYLGSTHRLRKTYFDLQDPLPFPLQILGVRRCDTSLAADGSAMVYRGRYAEHAIRNGWFRTGAWLDELLGDFRPMPISARGTTIRWEDWDEAPPVHLKPCARRRRRALEIEPDVDTTSPPTPDGTRHTPHRRNHPHQALGLRLRRPR